MNASEFYTLIKQQFPFTPTKKQEVVLLQLSEFIFSTDAKSLYLMKGYAGTGKTTIIGTLVSNLWKAKKSAVLLAPTGRAAKVISNYSGKEAFTIHKKIYFPKKEKGGGVKFVLQPNKHKNTIFIVDEASMIPDTPGESKFFENGSLLDDLMQYVYSGFNCKLMLVGDTAQLPPVKLDMSPALNPNVLNLNYNKEVKNIELDEVVRQESDSGILFNATNLREQLNDGATDDFKFDLNGFKDIVRLVDGYEIMDAINESYSNLGYEETAIVVRSNKRANLYNQQIRNRILFNENELTAGDYLMVVKNNYFWIKPTTEAGFIANGDIIEVLEIFKIEELYGFRFAEVKIKMVDYPKMKPFETVLLLDTITSETPSLSYDDNNRLYQEVMKDYQNETSNYRKFLKIKNNKHFNALQVKFSYAMTCHKSQGGQWHTVFVEQPYLPDGISKDYLRWLYTAVTRAKEKLYLIGFKDDFFKV
ncbi:AAA family ATPase [Mangrovimonas sp. AS39]|uniref:ATP-dependent DNA helicase n=1 Tax=Mangrovimonas TaxID=1211036 RepID=UPI00142271EA|nr:MULTISPECIES: AAA family ATPase [Mangrovimonas]MCF1191860.1 AAA family ATPase [Mangrovimonas futianensis]MCF1195252.1 AAA family ATPase [Mangrovimonas futianensis]MCF1422149.1 AAA family ATPase [Mangrovimonas futianensis]NIK91713.1 AAA family ATPase [Mangrovimonas sp. CR14]